MVERCAYCGFAFEYDDETTFEQATVMRNRHFEDRHSDVVAQPGIFTHDLSTRTVRYDAGPIRR